jgi:hypothetical protein
MDGATTETGWKMSISAYRISDRGNKRGNLLLVKPENGLDNGLGASMLASPLRQLPVSAMREQAVR